MSHADVPAEPPPSYSQATGSSAASHTGASSSSSNPYAGNSSSHLNVPGAGKDGSIPAAYRRSMEDEQRELPHGWVRSYDPSNNHQFFVDTTKDPPKSIWHHPYDDEDYLDSLTGAERERVEQLNIDSRRDRKHPSKNDYINAHSDDDDDFLPAQHQSQSGTGSSSTHVPAELPPRPDNKGKGPKDKSFGRKLKDKVTGMTHEQRVEERRRQAEEERKAYETHQKVRLAMQKAMQTGEAQYVGKDRDGKDVYIEPPAQQPGYAGGYSGGYPGRYGGGAYGYSPYGGNGIYTTPNARYIRPQMPYGRPYGGGFGGGYGMPLALGGGLLGGLLLGDMMF